MIGGGSWLNVVARVLPGGMLFDWILRQFRIKVVGAVVVATSLADFVVIQW